MTTNTAEPTWRPTFCRGSRWTTLTWGRFGLEWATTKRAEGHFKLAMNSDAYGLNGLLEFGQRVLHIDFFWSLDTAWTE